MSAGAVVVLMMMHAEEERRRREAEERRKREERERKRREEEERRRKEEHRKMIEHRKTSPVIYNGEEWQMNRCVKAFSLQTFVQDLVYLIEGVKPSVIQSEEKKCDEKILETGYEYELVKKDLDSDIDTLLKSGITIDGSRYEFSRLSPSDTNMATIEQTTESFGNIFTIKNGEPLELCPSILSSEGYYEYRYKEMDPEGISRELMEVNSKMQKYQKFGKYLSFLFRTKKYLNLEEKSEELVNDNEKCELRKREMESYKSLTKEQLLAIKSYFIHLDQLSKISARIKELFVEKASLRKEDNSYIYDLCIKEIMSNEDYSDLLSQVHEYISKMQSNDEATMNQAYILVRGEYPIEIERRFIYNLIFANMNEYIKDSVKQKNLS